jgi:anti-sigma factor RsiW
MDIEEKERLARRGNMSREAMAWRLVAARQSVGLDQSALARDMGEGMTKQKLRNAEKADNDPPKSLMRYFFRRHRIDFNFLIHGDFAQLPADVQDRLFPALAAQAKQVDHNVAALEAAIEALTNVSGQEAGSDRSRDAQQPALRSGKSKAS